jgi:hypothetical protein
VIGVEMKKLSEEATGESQSRDVAADPSPIPSDSLRWIACNQSKLVGFFDGIGHGRTNAAQYLKENGYITEWEKRGSTLWVILSNPADDDRFRAYLVARARADKRGKIYRNS